MRVCVCALVTFFFYSLMRTKVLTRKVLLFFFLNNIRKNKRRLGLGADTVLIGIYNYVHERFSQDEYLSMRRSLSCTGVLPGF